MDIMSDGAINLSFNKIGRSRMTSRWSSFIVYLDGSSDLVYYRSTIGIYVLLIFHMWEPY